LNFEYKSHFQLHGQLAHFKIEDSMPPVLFPNPANMSPNRNQFSPIMPELEMEE